MKRIMTSIPGGGGESRGCVGAHTYPLFSYEKKYSQCIVFKSMTQDARVQTISDLIILEWIKR